MIRTNPYPLRLEITLSKKLWALAGENNRSLNGEIEWILRKFVEQYEKEHGEISYALSEEKE